MPNEELFFVNSTEASSNALHDALLDKSLPLDESELVESTRKPAEEIEAVHAAKFIQNYREYTHQNIPHPMLTTKVGNVVERVKGFSFHKSEILAVLEQDDSISGIHLAFGINDGSVQTSPGVVKGKVGVTIIMHGLNANGKTFANGKMFDYSKPCPDNCPTSPEGVKW